MVDGLVRISDSKDKSINTKYSLDELAQIKKLK